MNLTNVLINREINLRKDRQSDYDMLKYVYTNFEYSPIQQYSFPHSLNHLALDYTNSFMIISDAGGNIHIYEVVNCKEGYLEFINRKDLHSIMIHRSQWLPNENEMISVTQPNIISLIDTNSFQIAETYEFNSKQVVYWSDWNSNDPNLIGVALCNSCIRLIDVRTGNSVQQITTRSPIQSKSHNMTRIIWTPLDRECFFAGDSSGYIHLYDIRRSKQAVQLAGEDYTSCEPICSMEYNPKKTNLIISQGRNNPCTTMWSFKRKKLRNTNVNFSMNREGKSKLYAIDDKSFIRYQVYVTDKFLFKPIMNSFKEISVFDLFSGKNLNTFSTSNWQPNSLCDASCVIGLYDNYNVMYSGSRNSLKLWNRKVVTDQEKEMINKIHQDNWSDSD